MDGFHIEKVVFESLPGIFVTALVYVPDGPAGRNPPCSSPAATRRRQGVLPGDRQRLAQRGYVVICWDPVGQGERSQFWDAAPGAAATT